VKAKRFKMTDTSQNELVVIQVDGENRIDSRLIAKSLDIEHEVFMRTCSKYQTELEELGALQFKIAARKNGNMGGDQPKYVMFNKLQILFSLFLVRNTPCSIRLNVDLLLAFEDDIEFKKILCGKHHEKENIVKSEMKIELAFVDILKSQNIDTRRQVKCEAGIADIVTPDVIYEVKSVLNQSALQKAVSQVIAYRACINPKSEIAVLGKKYHKEVSINFAKKLGVEILYWNDETQSVGN
jgi:phage regulator Rha-like protein